MILEKYIIQERYKELEISGYMDNLARATELTEELPGVVAPDDGSEARDYTKRMHL
jgi:hypothetical protein